jgi:hypothetical protein
MLELLKILANRINDFQIYSDVYKEVYGFRPQAWCKYGHPSWEFIQQENLRQVMEDSKAEDDTINAFMAAGAPDLDTAFRWLEDAENHEVYG